MATSASDGLGGLNQGHHAATLLQQMSRHLQLQNIFTDAGATKHQTQSSD